MLVVNAIFIILIALSAVISPMLIVYAWSRRARSPYAFLFMVFMAVVALWTLSSTFSFLSPTPEAAYFWSVRVRYIAVALLPVALAAFSVAYAFTRSILTPVRVGLMLLIPFTTIGILWSPFSDLFLSNFTFERIGSFMIRTANENGAWFWVHSIYGYTLTLIAFGVLVIRAVRSSYPYRGQAILMMMGVLLPVGTNLLIISNLLDPLPPDLTAVSFTATAVLWTAALFPYRLLDLSPVARNQVVEGMDDAVIVLDSVNRIVDLNPEARRIISSAQGPLLGESIERIFPERKDLIKEMNKTRNAHFEFEFGEGDARRVLDIRYNTLYGNKGQGIGRLIVLRDITERKAAEEERERLIGELDAYAHTVAHDLKNPLGVIISAVNYLRDFKPYIDEQKESDYLERIVRTSQTMLNIVDELLLLASVRKMHDISLTPLDMAAVITAATSRLSHEIETSEATISVQPEWPTALGYAPWVEEVWVNYVSNAIKYGGSPPQISLGADPPADGCVRFWVHDNGKGLKPEERAKLFTDFERLEVTATEGHGLGLSIVRRIVTRLGGKVGVESTHGEGSTFYFTLPIHSSK